jgi:hypothetical protein
LNRNGRIVAQPPNNRRDYGPRPLSGGPERSGAAARAGAERIRLVARLARTRENFDILLIDLSPRGLFRWPREVVSKILYLRQTCHFGPGKIADYVQRFHQQSLAVSSVHRILTRHGKTASRTIRSIAHMRSAGSGTRRRSQVTGCKWT